jgi:hypothetical protein
MSAHPLLLWVDKVKLGAVTGLLQERVPSTNTHSIVIFEMSMTIQKLWHKTYSYSEGTTQVTEVWKRTGQENI